MGLLQQFLNTTPLYQQYSSATTQTTTDKSPVISQCSANETHAVNILSSRSSSTSKQFHQSVVNVLGHHGHHCIQSSTPSNTGHGLLR